MVDGEVEQEGRRTVSSDGLAAVAIALLALALIVFVVLSLV